ncbi:MAG: hypothetical protein AAB920_01585 [Patescibacteria group bacterium]
MTKYISIIISVIVVIVIGVLVYMQLGKAPIQPVEQPIATTTTAIIPLPTPIITGVTMGTALTPEGTVMNATTTFKKTDNVYAVLALQDSLARTQISYIRTFNGKYVDSKVSHATEDGIKNFHFSWELVAGKMRTPGNYSLSFFMGGVKAQTVNYTVK